MWCLLETLKILRDPEANVLDSSVHDMGKISRKPLDPFLFARG